MHFTDLSILLLWIVSAFFALDAFQKIVLPALRQARHAWSREAQDRRAWRELAAQLLTLEETLRAGLAVDEARWRGLLATRGAGNTEPFREALVRVLLLLRERGARLLPTLQRARSLALFHAEELARSQAKTAQPRVQSWLASVCVPAFAFVLRTVMPEVESGFWTWSAGVLALAVWSAVGAVWVQRLAREAQWGGLAREQRAWLHAAPLGGEVFLASLQSGSPPDLAWTEMMDAMRSHAPDLVRTLPIGLWQSQEPRPSQSSELGNRILAWGYSVHQSVHVSLLEGKPCRERVEHLLAVLRQETLSAVEHAVEILPTRALAPLFLCTAPALLLTLAWTFSRSFSGVGLE